MLEEFKWILIYLFIKVKRGGGLCALVHVYIWEHIVTLNYRITWWIFTKLCRDKVLKTPLICIHFWAKSVWGRSRAGHNTSMRGPFSKELLLQSGMLQQQTECIAIIYKHLGVLMTPAHLYWLSGQIGTVVDPGQGHNKSMRALLQRTTWKATATNRMYNSDLTAFGKKCCYFFSILMSSFWHVLMLYCIGLGHFHLF